jgi:Protein of unknown function (DUF3489)
MAKTQTRKPAKGADKVNINKADKPAHKGQRQPRGGRPRAGLVPAAVLADTVAGTGAAASEPAAENSTPSITNNKAVGQSALQSEPGSQRADAKAGGVPSADLPRASTKRAMLIAMLERTQGAGVAEIGQRLGWLPHTVRAAITGLRHAGREVTRSKNDNGQTVYRLAPIETPDR